jgi:hypothetical protein
MTNFIAEQRFRIVILLLIFLTLVGIAYYFLYAIPQQQQTQRFEESSTQYSRQSQISDAESTYKTCLLEAQITFSSNWSANCLDKSHTSGCSIAISNADSLHSQLASDQDLCEKHYNDTLDSLK